MTKKSTPIPGLSFSWKRAIGITQVKREIAKKTGIPTSKGVQVGDPVSAVTDAYGKDCREVGMYYAYEDGAGKSLQFFIQNDAVQEISYYYDV